MKKLIILIIAAISCSTCNEKQISSNNEDEKIIIRFSGNSRTDGGLEFGIFEIINEGKMTVDIGIALDAEPSFCGSPAYEKLANNKWVRLPLEYASAAIFSPIHPGQKFFFEASVTKLKEYDNSIFRILISGTNGNYYYSDPFKYGYSN